LVVENDVPLLRLMAWALQDEHFAVSVSRNAEEASKVIPDTVPDVIVVNSDVPVADKKRAIAELRSLVDCGGRLAQHRCRRIP
jgi:DNA-binding response OmpR family regulator